MRLLVLLVANCFVVSVCFFFISQELPILQFSTVATPPPTLVPCKPNFKCTILVSPLGRIQLHFVADLVVASHKPYSELTLPSGKQITNAYVVSWSYDDQFAILAQCPIDPVNRDPCPLHVWDMVKSEEIKGVGASIDSQWVPDEHAIATVMMRREPPSTVWYREIYYLGIMDVHTKQITIPDECPSWYKRPMYTRSPIQCLGRPGFAPLPTLTSPPNP